MSNLPWASALGGLAYSVCEEVMVKFNAAVLEPLSAPNATAGTLPKATHKSSAINNHKNFFFSATLLSPYPLPKSYYFYYSKTFRWKHIKILS